MLMRASLAVLFVSLAALFGGCGDDDPQPATDASVGDASVADGSVDASSGPDAGRDGAATGADASLDAAPDAQVDIFEGLDSVLTASIDGDGKPGGDDSRPFAISGNGRFVVSQSVFAFDAADTNDTNDIYVHDVVLGTTVLLSRTRSGSAATGMRPAISGDGRYVAYVSASADILAEGEDTNDVRDGFILDRDTDGDGVFDEFAEVGGTRVWRFSVADDGTENDGVTGELTMSASGRFIVYDSNSSKLTAGLDGTANIFVHDRDTDEDGVFDEAGAVSTRLVSRESSGAASSEPCAMRSVARAISEDGRYVAFRGHGDNLVAGDDNGQWDYFVVDRDTDQDGVFDEDDAFETVRVNVASDGSQSEGEDVNRADISSDGRWVFIQSRAANLVEGDDNGEADIFVHDRDADEDGLFDEPGAITTSFLVKAGEDILDGASGAAVASHDGRFVAFSTGAENLESPPNGAFDVFVVDRDPDENGKFDTTPAVARASRTAAGAALTDESSNPRISADGRALAFATFATELGATGLGGDVEYAQSGWALNPLF